MYYVGLDVHDRYSNLCILDEAGAEVQQWTVLGDWNRLVEVLGARSEPMEVCFEASCGYGHLYDQLATVAKRVLVVAHPGKLRLIFQSKRKNDRADAKKLATLLMIEAVPPVYVPDQDTRNWRRLIEYRQRLVQRRVSVKNTLRTVLRRFGIRAPRGLWTQKGRAWLASVELPDRASRLERDQLMDEYQQITRRIGDAERELDEIRRNHPGVRLLRTIPGVGLRTAEAVVAYIDRPERFANSKQVSAYIGLVPRQDQSGNQNRLGHITREGPATVRRLLVEAAWQAKRRSPRVAEYFERLKRGKKDRQKIALVATANHLLRAMHAMLKSGQGWCEQPEEARAAG